MFDYRKQLRTNLLTIGLPVYDELFLTTDAKVPCITYRLSNDYSEMNGDTLGYSYITYSVKIWTHKVAEMVTYSAQIDDIMREAGFTRTNSHELWADTTGQLELVYRGLAKEEF